MGYTDSFLKPPRIPLVIRGLQGSESGNKPKNKLPVTALVFYSIKLQLDHSKADDIILWVACCTAFFGFMRSSEFTVPVTDFQSELHLSLADVSIDTFPIHSVVYLYLSHS